MASRDGCSHGEAKKKLQGRLTTDPILSVRSVKFSER